MAKIKYNGIELESISECKVFDEPHEMFVWNSSYNEPIIKLVCAVIPYRHIGSVIAEKDAYEYCAEIIGWHFKKVCKYIHDNVGGLVVEDNGLLYYDGLGHNEKYSSKNIIANGACVYPQWYNNESHITYDCIDNACMERLVNTIKDYNELNKVRKGTYRDIARWLAHGNGEVTEGIKIDGKGPNVKSSLWYSAEKSDDTVSNEVRIRNWDDTEWHVPTVNYMGIEQAEEEK